MEEFLNHYKNDRMARGNASKNAPRKHANKSTTHRKNAPRQGAKTQRMHSKKQYI